MPGCEQKQGVRKSRSKGWKRLSQSGSFETPKVRHSKLRFCLLTQACSSLPTVGQAGPSLGPGGNCLLQSQSLLQGWLYILQEGCSNLEGGLVCVHLFYKALTGSEWDPVWTSHFRGTTGPQHPGSPRKGGKARAEHTAGAKPC